MMAQLDPFFANQVHNMKRSGQISPVFKSSFGYHVVKYMGRRNITFDKVENMIMYKLYSEGLETQFKKWVEKKKEESAITIFMDNYVQG
jgi:parvulin-like peptidyl-prolyl isomerase